MRPPPPSSAALGGTVSELLFPRRHQAYFGRAYTARPPAPRQTWLWKDGLSREPVGSSSDKPPVVPWLRSARVQRASSFHHRRAFTLLGRQPPGLTKHCGGHLLGVEDTGQCSPAAQWSLAGGSSASSSHLGSAAEETMSLRTPSSGALGRIPLSVGAGPHLPSRGRWRDTARAGAGQGGDTGDLEQTPPGPSPCQSLSRVRSSTLSLHGFCPLTRWGRPLASVRLRVGAQLRCSARQRCRRQRSLPGGRLPNVCMTGCTQIRV